MPIFETIGNLVLKRGVSALVKMSIDKFDISKTTQGKLQLLIATLKEDIEFEEKIELESVGTVYSETNLDNYYKLAQAYGRQRFFEDELTGFSKTYEQKAVEEIEKRLDVLVDEKKKGIVYNYLAQFYTEVDIKKSEHYNLLALEHKKELTSTQKATIYMRQALSELFYDEADKALKNIANATELEPSNNYFKMIEIRILLKLNKLDNLFNKIYELIDEFKRLNDNIQLSDVQVLLAQYWQKKEDEVSALKAFTRAYELVEKLPNSSLDFKKSYLLMNIALHEESESKATESIELNYTSQYISKHRLDLIEIADTLHDKGFKFDDDGEYDKALEFNNKALKIKVATLGENHPSTANTYNNIGSAWKSKGEYDKALEFYNKALEIELATLGENHPLTATTYNNIGFAWKSKGEYDKALEFYNKALEIRLAILGENHPLTATSYNNIGLAWKSKGEYDKALEFYNKALEIELATSGENHPLTANSYNNIGLVWDSKGEYEKAMEFYNKSLKIRLATLGENHLLTSTIYNNIGLVWDSKGEYDKALKFHNKALEIRLSILGENHSKIATSYMGIGSAWYGKLEYDKAIEFYNKALKIRLAIFGENHPDVSDCYNAIGSALDSNGEYDKAIKFHNKALEIRLSIFGENHPRTATSYNNIGSVYDSKEEYDKAIDFYNRALKILIVIVGENHPRIELFKGNFERAKKKLNNL